MTWLVVVVGRREDPDRRVGRLSGETWWARAVSCVGECCHPGSRVRDRRRDEAALTVVCDQSRDEVLVDLAAQVVEQRDKCGDELGDVVAGPAAAHECVDGGLVIVVGGLDERASGSPWPHLVRRRSGPYLGYGLGLARSFVQSLRTWVGAWPGSAVPG